ncbi:MULTISPECIES: DUF3948 family protein [Bacillus]|nr:DUF3948 family protein [Bacillus wiedmannii]PEW51745.1 DUF3948 domain-containing protein [Bacillus cereus]PFW75908.1 DUF3948 domain-containing protein [Bacillus sp. AFS075960]RFB09264.1 DUF3948 family protein [Bacillus sp. OE]RFB39155.1 DUF3948 family protein [Bacillus sp. dmp10]RFB68970.1 DUF3948 family protein [Bacillus sp. AW]
MNNITFNKLDFLGLASGSLLLTAFIYAATLDNFVSPFPFI